MSNYPIIYSDRLKLVPLSMEHLSIDYVEWLNDIEVYKYLETGGNYTLEKLTAFLSDVVHKNILFYAVHIKSTNIHIGNIKIDPINTVHNIGEYGIMMGRRSEWNKGYAKEASLRIIEYCFDALKLRKITLGVIADNQAAVALYYKLGFVKEGEYVDHAFHNGKYCNVLRMAIFNPNSNS